MESFQTSRKRHSHRIMGSVLSVICMAAILVSTLPPATVFAEQDLAVAQQTTATVTSQSATTTDRLNLREGPNTTSRVLTVLETGTVVTVLDNSNAQWVRVRTSNGQEGYCSREYLNISNTAVAAATTATTTDHLNLRQGPGSTYSVLTVLPLGTVVTVVDNSNAQWVRVRTSNGQEGYCSREYLAIGDNHSPSTPPSNVSLSLDTKQYTNTAGKSYRFLARVSGSNTTPTVTSSNPNIVTVTYGGKDARGYLYDIKTIAPGNASISVSVDGTSVTMPVTVTGSSSDNNSSSSTPNPNISVSLDTKQYTNTAGKSYRFLARVSGSNTTPTVTSSNPNVVTVTYGGKDARGYLYDIKTIAPGNASISVSVDGTSATMPVTVTGNNPSSTPPASNVSLSLDTKQYTNAAGKSYRFLARITGGSGAAPVVTSSNQSVVTVAYGGKDSRGYLYDITTVAPGSAVITVTVDGKSATMPVTVTGAVAGDPSTSTPSSSNPSSSTPTTNATLSLDTNSYTNGPGSTYQFLARVSGGSGTTPSVTSSNHSVVTVAYASKDSRGYLYTLKTVSPGSAVITVSVDGKSATLPVTVTNTVNGNVGNVVDPISKKTVKTAITTTELNLRGGPATTYERITTLAANAQLTPLDFTSNGWLKVRTADSRVGYVSTEYLTYVFTDGSTTAAQVSLSPSPNSISTSIPQGKTLYMTATQSGKKITGLWSSSNTDVATVSNGYIYGANPGTATITVMDPTGSTRASMTVTITAAEPVKTAYVNPNIASVNKSVELVAVTDNTRNAVDFVVDMGGGRTQTVRASTFTSESSANTGLATNNTRVWRANITFNSAGTYPIQVYSYKNGTRSTSAFSTSAYVVSTQDETTTSVEQRRISDKMLEIIGKWEGYSAAVYPDTLANNIPTIGYGHTFSAGAQFYNNLTKTEAWSLLCNTINTKAYTSEVNRFITSNNLRTNQQQFDAMVSFSYNIGAGYWNNASAAFDMRTVMLNAVVPPSVPASGLPATTSLNTYLYQDKSTSSTKQQALTSGVSLTVLSCSYDSSTHAGWYRVRLANGTEGWIQSGYVRFASSVAVTHDLNYTDAVPFGSEAVRWSTAGGTCYAGLVYRRLGEAKVFSFGDYTSATPGNENYGRNTYGYVYPSYAQPYEKKPLN